MGTVWAPAWKTRVALRARSDPGAQGCGDQGATGADGGLGEGALGDRTVPSGRGHAAQVAVERKRLVTLLVEHAAGLAPVVHALLAGQDRLARGGWAGPAGGRGAQLGQLLVAAPVELVLDLTLGGDVAGELGQLLGGQVARLFGGPGKDGIGGGARGGTPLAQLIE
jgi:hypothetical protein